MASGLVVGAAPCDGAALKRLYQTGDWQSVIAVDGGYETLVSAGIHPSLALGDFDSLGYEPKDVDVQAFSPIKDQSDMELALDYVQATGLDEVYIFGALGGRLDHTLANLALFAAASEYGLRVVAAGETQALAMLTGPATFHLPAAPRGVVSVFALNDVVTGLTEEGLFYPLNDATLTHRTSLGLSNELVGQAVAITVATGTIAIFYPLELLLGS